MDTIAAASSTLTNRIPLQRFHTLTKNNEHPVKPPISPYPPCPFPLHFLLLCSANLLLNPSFEVELTVAGAAPVSGARRQGASERPRHASRPGPE